VRIIARFSALFLILICLCPDSGLSQSPNQDTNTAGTPESLNKSFWPRFGLRLSLGVGRIETPNLAEAFRGFDRGRFEQGNSRVSPGAYIEAELSPHVRLSLGVEYTTTQFRFHPSIFETPLAQDTWDVSFVPISMRLSYSPPVAAGPFRVALGLGGSLCFSSVKYLSNYATIDVGLPLFLGRSSTGTAWGGSVHAGVLLDITNAASIELAGEYEMTSGISNIEFQDPRTGVSSLAYKRTIVEMNLQRWSLSLGFVYFLL
jgi:hypothetical protein